MRRSYRLAYSIGRSAHAKVSGPMKRTHGQLTLDRGQQHMSKGHTKGAATDNKGLTHGKDTL
jgi:hypothetical protein